jgi:drug/metabolite transporter (DMT)-like permease
MVIWNHGVDVIGGAKGGPYLNMVPLVSVLGGYLLLGEHLHQATLLAGVLIVSGVALPQVWRRS